MHVSDTIVLCANRTDHEWLDAVRRHLAPFRAHGLVAWDPRDIRGGARTDDALAAAVAKARLVVLLVSPDFLAHEFAEGSDLRDLFLKAAGEGKRTLWLPILASAHAQTPLRDLQPLRDPKHPLAKLPEAEAADALVEICDHIVSAVRPDHQSAPIDLSDQPYQLIRPIRVGGLSTVWLAEERATRTQVAVKVLHPQYVKDSEIRRRFLRGAQEAMKLQHPAIVKILDPHGEAHDRLYYVMQYIDGGNLHDAVTSGALPPERRIDVLVKICEALVYAHKQGILHRDVHPGNILLDKAGRPYLGDFDLVRSLKIDYSAPELRDDADDSDPRVDVYGLGMTTVFALHGKDLDPDEVADVPRVIEALPCSRALKKVLQCAVARESERRFPGAAALGEALAAAAAGKEPRLPDSKAAASLSATPVVTRPEPPTQPAATPRTAPAPIVDNDVAHKLVDNLAGAGRGALRLAIYVIIAVAALLALAIVAYMKSK